MQAMTEKIFHASPPHGLFDMTSIRNLYRDHGHGAIKALLHRACKKGEIIRLKKGIFCLAEPFRESTIHPFALAGILHYPSFVSLESALGYHGVVPEAVYQTASITSDRSRAFSTPLGTFSYQTVPCRFLKAGVRAHKLDKRSWAFIATPLRAIADIIYFRKEVLWKSDGLHFLKASLRIEDEDLEQIPREDFDEIGAGIRNQRVREYLEGMRRELIG